MLLLSGGCGYADVQGAEERGGHQLDGGQRQEVQAIPRRL